MSRTKSTIPGAQGVEPSDETRLAVLSLIRRHGEAKAGKLLGDTDRLVLARAAAGLPLREGTLLKLEAALAAPAPAGDSKQLDLPLVSEAA